MSRKPPKDLLLPVGETESGDIAGLRCKANADGDREISLSVFRKLQDGVAVTGDIVSARAVEGTPYLALTTEVEQHRTSVPSTPSTRTISIPSDDFQRGWDRIWGQKSTLPGPDETVH